VAVLVVVLSAATSSGRQLILVSEFTADKGLLLCLTAVGKKPLYLCELFSTPTGEFSSNFTPLSFPELNESNYYVKFYKNVT